MFAVSELLFWLVNPNAQHWILVKDYKNCDKIAFKKSQKKEITFSLQERKEELGQNKKKYVE